MKREIKFRAWDGKENKMYLPEYSDNGDFYITGDGYVEHRKEVGYEGHELSFSRDGLTLMQFTGLKDKNGACIYEGDIVLISGYGNTIIVWNENICSFQYAYHAIGRGSSVGGRMTNTLYDHESAVRYDVIGNIYENPELLTPSQ